MTIQQLKAALKHLAALLELHEQTNDLTSVSYMRGIQHAFKSVQTRLAYALFTESPGVQRPRKPREPDSAETKARKAEGQARRSNAARGE